MTIKVTEQLHTQAVGLDDLPPGGAARRLIEAQIAAVTSLGFNLDYNAPILHAAATAMARTIRSGGILHYVAAGSSGLMAMADAMELGGTFSINPAQVCIHMAGGMPQDARMPGDVEDKVSGIVDALGSVVHNDTIIAVSASGTTPYTLAAAEVGQAKNAKIIGVANNKGASLLALADFPVLLETPPEVISGSTRLGAATIQKIVLNTLSSLMAIQLGHVHDGMMVNLQADNIKLRDRAARIVAQIAQVQPHHALKALERADGQVKTAIIMAAGRLSVDDAHSLLGEVDGVVRAALARLK